MSDNTHRLASSAKKNKKLRSRHWTKRWLFRVFILTLLLFCYTIWQMWDIHRFGHNDINKTADCAIVLGAAAYHQKPSPVFKARIDHAILLLKQNRIKFIILTGGYGENAKYAESEVAKKYCLDHGVSLSQIHIETNSKNTEDNIIEAKKIMRAQGFKNSLIVSDPWHLKRACNIAAHYKIDAHASATKTSLYTSETIQILKLWQEFIYLHLWRFN